MLPNLIPTPLWPVASKRYTWQWVLPTKIKTLKGGAAAGELSTKVRTYPSIIQPRIDRKLSASYANVHLLQADVHHMVQAFLYPGLTLHVEERKLHLNCASTKKKEIITTVGSGTREFVPQKTTPCELEYHPEFDPGRRMYRSS